MAVWMGRVWCVLGGGLLVGSVLFASACVTLFVCVLPASFLLPARPSSKSLPFPLPPPAPCPSTPPPTTTTSTLERGGQVVLLGSGHCDGDFRALAQGEFNGHPDARMWCAGSAVCLGFQGVWERGLWRQGFLAEGGCGVSRAASARACGAQARCLKGC